MNSLRLTTALSAAIAAFAAGTMGSVAIAQTSTSISPTAPYNVQADPNGNVQIAPGNVTQPSNTPLNTGIQNNSGVQNNGTTGTSTSITSPVSPTAPFGVQSSPNGNVQILPGGNTTQTGGTTNGSVNSPSGVTTSPVSPTAPFGVQSSPNGNVQILPGGNNVQPGGTTNGSVNSPSGVTTSPVSPTAPFGVQSSPNGNVQILPGGNNVQPGGSRPTAPNAPGIIQIIPTSPSGTPQSTAFPGSSIVIQSPTGGAANSTPQPSQGQAVPGGGTLDAQLLQATCNQNWGQAIQIVNRALAAAPASASAYRTQLSGYKSRLQTLQSRGVQVPNWQQQCTQGFTATQLSAR